MRIKLGHIQQKSLRAESRIKDLSELILKKKEILQRRKILVLDLDNI
jgi:hypothetical protein